jgi:hypothetical protein
LSILRVVILVAATLALLVAAVGAASAVPLLLKRVGLIAPDEASTTLADFISGKKSPAQSEGVDDSPARNAVHPDLATAARNVKRYLSDRSSHPVEHWEEVLGAYWQEVPAEADDEYAKSVRELSAELLVATGKPLSLERVEELLLWHFQRYMGNLQGREAQKAAADMQFLMAIGGAATAFVIFVFIVFIFLFVKIERSLRLVRVVRSDDNVAMTEPYNA